MLARGKRVARRPWYHEHTVPRPERPKYRGNYAPSGLEISYCFPGATRFALAPGFHIPRRWRSVSTLEAKLLDGYMDLVNNSLLFLKML
jgi:hypothetical protein